MKLIPLPLVLLVFLTACSTPSELEETPIEEPVTEESVETPVEEVKEVACEIPVPTHELTLYTSEDGLSFTKQNALLERTSVPNLFYDEEEEDFIVSFQSFENLSNLCDQIAYTRLSTDGEITQEVQPIKVESELYFRGFDPTLISVKDQMVMVYTVRPQGKKYPCISMAVAETEDVADGFIGLDQILWCSENDDENYMDASAVVVGEEVYLYLPSDKAMSSTKPVSYFAKVDVSSEDSSEWEVMETDSINDLGLFLLGEMVETDDSECPYAFYGTYKGSVKRVCSQDGLNFDSSAASILSSGADPGVWQLPDGTYVMVVTE